MRPRQLGRAAGTAAGNAAAAFAAAVLMLAAATPALAHEGEPHMAAATGVAPFMTPVAIGLAALLLAASFLLISSAVRAFGARGREDGARPSSGSETAD